MPGFVGRLHQRTVITQQQQRFNLVDNALCYPPQQTIVRHTDCSQSLKCDSFLEGPDIRTIEDEQAFPTGERVARNSAAQPDQPSRNPTNKRRRSSAPRNCAECRRLKLRCDKIFPCVSCVKRGLAAICPDGSLTTGQGNRLVLASTEELHERIAVLSQRIRLLEDALQAAQGTLGADPHPLLSDDLLALKAPLQRDVPSGGAPIASPHKFSSLETNEPLLEALGSLSIRDKGSVNYFGQTATSWHLLQNEETDDIPSSGTKSHLPSYIHPYIVENSGAFLLSLLPSGLGSISNEGCRDILGSLPSPSVARHLRDLCFERVTWHYSPIKLDQFNEDVFRFFYEHEFMYTSTDYSLFQRVAILYFVLAIGSAMDPASEMHNEGSERYYQLALASLFHGRPIQRPTIHGVQALLLAFTYSYFVDQHDSCEVPSRWALLGMVIRLAHAIGLHRDSSKFGLSEQDVQLRRTLLCEIRFADYWQAFTTGRPPGMSVQHLDTTPPIVGSPSDPEQLWLSFKHRWLAQCLDPFLKEAGGSKPLTHAQVMRRDRIIRSIAIPTEYAKTSQLTANGQPPPEFVSTIPFIMRRGCALAVPQIMYMYLHRHFFLQAINDRPDDPARGPYGSSFLACYQAAVGGLQVCKELRTGPAKEVMSRIWFWWAHLSSCAIFIATSISKCPSSSVAPSALEHLNVYVDLFQPVAHHFRAEKICAILVALRDKANRALHSFRSAPGLVSIAHDEDDESVVALGGRTRVVSPLSHRGVDSSEATLREMQALLGFDVPAAAAPYHDGAYEAPAQVSSPIQAWFTDTAHHDLSSYLSSNGWTGNESQAIDGESVAFMFSHASNSQSAPDEQPMWPNFNF